MKENKKDIPYIHYLRVLACIGVLCIHCTHISLKSNTDIIFNDILRCICHSDVPLFLMITGALLFTSIKKKEIDILEFYKSKIPRILSPLIIWSIIYSIIPYFINNTHGKTIIINILYIPIQYPKEIGGILWYLYVIIGIYLIIPFITNKLYNNQRMIKIFLLFWLISSLGLIVRKFLPEIWGESKYVNSYDMLHYFSGYYGFLLLGYKLHINTNISNNKLNKSILGLIFSLVILYIIRVFLKDSSWGIMLNHIMFPTRIVVSYYTYKIIRDIKICDTSYIYIITKHISKYTFGIYLCHMAIYSLITKTLLYPYNTAWYTQITTILLTSVLSYILCRLMEKLPFSKHIIGV